MTTSNKRPVVLAILDGWGFGKKEVGNPIKQANTPVMDGLAREYPMTLLQASGQAVGMTWGESGNSEVGHLSIGAGRIIEQYFSRISRSISDKTFFSNPALAGAYEYAQKNKSKVHLIGLLTSGTVHSAFTLIPALLDLAVQNDYPETYLHLFLDGKDSGLQEGAKLLESVGDEIRSRSSGLPAQAGKLATVIGRNFAMDRDNNWELTQKTYELLAKGVGEKSSDLPATIKNYYQQGQNDSSMPPVVAADSGFSGIADNDSLIFFNFREDSMRQILKPFIEPDFSLFPYTAEPSGSRPRADLKNLYVCTMTQYLENPAVAVAFLPPDIANGLAEILSASGKNQLHIAETEKYAHVTYFFNGLNTKAYDGETDVFIESIKDHKNNPAMKSWEIATKAAEEIKRGFFDFIVLNIPNPDVLAHTGDFAATVKGVEATDKAVGLIKDAIFEKDGTLIITADHGNAEGMVYKSTGEAETRHESNPVPFYLVARQYQANKTPETIAGETGEAAGILADVAPTILELMEIPQPAEMTGKSLLSILGR
jgi:2,3-bisphosphoglycerate-independent phosphoglycerate mutase